MHLWRDPPLVLGHRGSPKDATENTIPSFQAAVAAGARGVELDARLSRDGEVMVHHDAELGRTFPGSSLIEDEDSADLVALGVPTLRAVLEAIPSALVDVELKADAASAGEMPARVAAVVLEARALDRVLVTSFDWELAHAYGDLAQRDVGAIVPFPIEPKDLAGVPRARHVAMAFESISPDVARAFADEGILLYAWTVNDQGIAQKLVEMGVRSIITDRPGPMVRALSPTGGPAHPSRRG